MVEKTMSNVPAYHTVVNALEGRSGWTPLSRFAAAIVHAVDGHLPYSRYHAAGLARRREAAGRATIEQMVSDWLATDLNPVVQIVRTSNRSATAIAGFNAYNASAPRLAVRTSVSMTNQGDTGEPTISVKRDLLSTEVDPEPCGHATVAIFDTLLRAVRRNEQEGLTPKSTNLVDLAYYLGVEHSAAGEAALVLQSAGPISITELAREIGCHQRTLERRLRQEGVTAELLRLATRLLRATRQLGSSHNLTTIAMDAGFADQAHMTRAFRASCGMTPSLLRGIARGAMSEIPAP